MILNEGTADRIIRLVIAAAAVPFSWWAGFGSAGGILLLVFAGWMLVTGAVGYCPGLSAVQVQHAPFVPPDLNAGARGSGAPLAAGDRRQIAFAGYGVAAGKRPADTEGGDS